MVPVSGDKFDFSHHIDGTLHNIDINCEAKNIYYGKFVINNFFLFNIHT